jgi:hypothetical protein
VQIVECPSRCTTRDQDVRDVADHNSMSNPVLPTVEATNVSSAAWPAPAGVPVAAAITIEMPVTEIAAVAASVARVAAPAAQVATPAADAVSSLDPAWESRFCKMVDTLYVPKSLQRRQLQLATN